MGRRPILFLCEGKNDYNFLKSIVVEKISSASYGEKDEIIRRMYEKGISASMVVIVEGGKERLMKNVPIIVSKMRSMRRRQEVFALVDCDHDTPDNLSKKIFEKISNIVSNPRRFPSYKPEVKFTRRGSFYYVISVTYAAHITLLIHVLTVPRALEYWVRGKRSLDYLKGDPWFRELIRALKELGIEVRP